MPTRKKQFVKSVPPDRLKAWRKRKGFSQAQAADFLQVPVRTYQNWEGGRPQAFPDWLRQQMNRTKEKKVKGADPAQLSFQETES